MNRVVQRIKERPLILLVIGILFALAGLISWGLALDAADDPKYVSAVGELHTGPDETYLQLVRNYPDDKAAFISCPDITLFGRDDRYIYTAKRCQVEGNDESTDVRSFAVRYEYNPTTKAIIGYSQISAQMFDTNLRELFPKAIVDLSPIF